MPLPMVPSLTCLRRPWTWLALTNGGCTEISGEVLAMGKAPGISQRGGAALIYTMRDKQIAQALMAGAWRCQVESEAGKCRLTEGHAGTTAS